MLEIENHDLRVIFDEHDEVLPRARETQRLGQAWINQAAAIVGLRRAISDLPPPA
jgi:hypothetical protein